MAAHRSAMILTTFVMATLATNPVVAQDKSIIQIYDLGPNDAATVVRVMQTMIPRNNALAFLTEDSSHRLIASATRTEHLAIRNTLFRMSNPVKDAISELPPQIAKRRNGDVFLSYSMPNDAMARSAEETAKNLLKHVDSARLDIDSKTNNLLVLAPWSTHVELGKLLFGGQD